MIVRNCAGGVVFHGHKVFILKNDKDEWVLPKGKIRNGFLPTETALERVKCESGIVDAEIISTAGETNYEFFSYSRQQPVFNVIIWYIMECNDEKFMINKEEGFTGGGFFDIDEAVEKITYSQDKSLVRLSYKKYLKLKEFPIGDIEKEEMLV
ncbi:NUDIX hydrolase [Acidilutibacter cellobiosedens]|jgi:predicted NUDIX family NTP pyrophosphohydrolase|uniref:NUDIX hydrolase n=1 Tax=Acidilutibacter cellobiosedens TaxID=2507161 RepID=A0A410QDP2_9FIRM|nr:NUDIX hydrolase [Acidilutibacter cellobiosedens]QAT62110.1 NUDIX hydrolase [Acidilutibacter cellobiosedens]